MAESIEKHKEVYNKIVSEITASLSKDYML